VWAWGIIQIDANKSLREFVALVREQADRLRQKD
jgi:hypothetical protein